MFLGIALLVQSPQLALVALGNRGLGAGGGDASPLAILGLLLPLLALTQVQAGLVAPGVQRALNGDPVRLSSCLPRKAVTLAGVFLGSILVAMAAACGFLFFLLPGWVVLTGFFVALPALAVEGLSPAAALGLSWRLTAKSWLPLFALVFMFTVLERLLSLALGWSGAPLLVAALPAIPISAFQAIASGVAYSELRRGPSARESPVPQERL